MEPLSLDQQAEALINDFMLSLLKDDFKSASEAVLPFVHGTLKTERGESLNKDSLDFEFKKAFENAKFYSVPVEITRTEELKTTHVGHESQSSFEKGSERKYWVAKKEGQPGMPAPLVVFFPEDGGDAKISYMGSL